MFKIHSVVGRIFIGKMIGLISGIIFIILLPTFGFPLFSFIGFGALIMFMIMGAVIGFIGQFDRHPVFNFKMHWWLRGSVVGFAFMLMFILLSHDAILSVMQSTAVSWMGLNSPFWALIDGVIIGGFMGWAETKFAGEGSELPLA